MKTQKTMKALFAAGLISLGAVLSSQADTTVYSVNAVGFVNLTIPAGYSMISNPLSTSNNTLDNVIPSVVAGTTVYQWTGTGFKIATYDGGWTPANHGITMNPGQGVFIFTVNSATLTFVGEVPTGNTSNISIPAGYSIVGSPVPQTGSLSSLQFPAQPGDTVYRYINNQYQISTWDGSTWSGQNPTPAVGEAFWSYKVNSQSWTRNFSISQ